MKGCSMLLLCLLALSFQAQAQDAPSGAGNNAPGSDPAPSSGAGHQPGAARERFQGADADHDGKLTRAEAQAIPFVAKHFDDIDSNRDGYVTRDELRSARSQMHAARAQRSGQGPSDGPAPQAPNPPGSGT